ncbi:hypothetical protein [Algoriphagus terrigena]|nr:hypothetical protein [Algoriphagus terrigena]
MIQKILESGLTIMDDVNMQIGDKTDFEDFFLRKKLKDGIWKG